MKTHQERLIAFMANRTDRLRAVLEQERSVVAPPAAAEARASGIAFYQGDEVLHKKRPVPAGESLVLDLDVHTDCALLHLGQPASQGFRSADVGPFRFRQWSYAQLGGGASEACPVEALPDFLRRSMGGNTPAERCFHTILHGLHAAGALERPSSPRVLEALRAMIRACGPTEPWALALTNGAQTYAFAQGLPLYHLHRRGELHYSLLVAGCDEPPPSPYTAVHDGSVAIVERDLSLTAHHLG